MSRIIQNFKNHLINIPGWRTDRKIIVFESDDWGSIRMSSKQAYYSFLKKGYPVDRSVYNRFDALENNDDVEALMDILVSVKDRNSNPAKFTINNIVANPDFLRIRSNDFNKYFFETFPDILSRNKSSENVMRLYKQGLNQKLFQIQFHGREHVHVNNWLSKLRKGDNLFLDAFGEGMFTLNNENGNSCKFECLNAMAAYNQEDLDFIKQAVKEGLVLFEKIWGYKSRSVIAPCYTWPTSLETSFKENGVKFIQGARAQREPIYYKDSPKIKRHYQGEKNRSGLIYLIRNVNFEQAENAKIDIVASALKEIETAFLWGKPAVISSHRVNYIGSIDPNNRKRNLVLLKILLNKIVEKYPTVEFMSSDELGRLIEKN